MPTGTREGSIPLYAIIFASGAAALIFQTLWLRLAGLAFGNTVWASSLVLSSFMGGLAVGNGLAARFGQRVQSPIRVYAIAESVVALVGCALAYILPVLGVMFAPQLGPLLDRPWILNLLRLVVAFVALLLPASAMGLTLPLFTKALASNPTRFGPVLGSLYGWNTLGAVVGAIAGDFYLLRVFGVRGTAAVAGALNLLAAAASLRFSSGRQPQRAQRTQTEMHLQPSRAVWPWLAASFLSGFCLLALEVVWFRLLLLFVMGDSTAFALMLAVVLMGIAVGGLVASVWLRVSPESDRWTAPLIAAAGLVTIACYAAFPAIVTPFDKHQIGGIREILDVSWPLVLPVSICSGIIFTFTGAALRRQRDSEIQATGDLTLANTAGGAIGSLVSGFVLLPVLGRERALIAIAVLYAVTGLLLVSTTSAGRRLATYAVAGVLLLAVIGIPSRAISDQLIDSTARRFAAIRRSGGDLPRVEAVRDGLTETIVYFRVPFFGRPLFDAVFMNSIPMADTQYVSRRYMKLYVYWPTTVHRHLKHALLIAYGIGNTAKAMTDSRNLKTIDVVDLSRDVLAISDLLFPGPDANPLNDPRVRVHVEDGRYFLSHTEQRFDLITGEPPPPHSAGVVNLYTREYFQMLYDRLAEGGIVTYWLPVHAISEVSTKAILRGFCDAFRDCSLWHGMGSELMMVGTRNASGPVTEEEFARQWNDATVAPELIRLGFERPEQLGALFIGDSAYLASAIGNAPPLVDDDPKLIDAPIQSQQEADRLLRSFVDESAARERFGKSSLIAKLWPKTMIAASLPYFAVQQVINAHSLGQPPAIENMHLLMTGSDLRTLVLWLLGSDSDVQRLVATATPSELDTAPMQLHLGIGLLSARNYAAAVEPLARAELDPSFRSRAFDLRMYALCMAGRIEEAQSLVDERFARTAHGKGSGAESLTDASSTPFWAWMKRTFGIERH